MADGAPTLLQLTGYVISFRKSCRDLNNYVKAQRAKGEELDLSVVLNGLPNPADYVAVICFTAGLPKDFVSLCNNVKGFLGYMNNSISKLAQGPNEFLAEFASEEPISEEDADAALQRLQSNQVMQRLGLTDIPQNHPHSLAVIAFPRFVDRPVAAFEERRQREDGEKQQPASALEFLQQRLLRATAHKDEKLAKLEAAEQDAANDPSYDEVWRQAVRIVRKMTLHHGIRAGYEPIGDYKRIWTWVGKLTIWMRDNVYRCGNALASVEPKSKGLRQWARIWVKNREIIDRKVRINGLISGYNYAYDRWEAICDEVTEELQKNEIITMEE